MMNPQQQMESQRMGSMGNMPMDPNLMNMGMMPNMPNMPNMGMMPPPMNMFPPGMLSSMVPPPGGMDDDDDDEEDDEDDQEANEEIENLQAELARLRKDNSKLNSELDQEFENNRVLEQKCEEYLNQLQRSADIIENAKERQKMEFERMEDRLVDLEDALAAERTKASDFENENRRLKEDLDILKKDRDGDTHEFDRLRDDIIKGREKAKELEEQLEKARAAAERKDQEVDGLKNQISNLTIDRDKITNRMEFLEDQLDAKDKELKNVIASEDTLNRELRATESRLSELQEDNKKLGDDRERMYDRLDEKQEENNRLKEEIFLLKKMMMEFERKDHEIKNLRDRFESEASYDRDPPRRGSFGNYERNSPRLKNNYIDKGEDRLDRGFRDRSPAGGWDRERGRDRRINRRGGGKLHGGDEFDSPDGAERGYGRNFNRNNRNNRDSRDFGAERVPRDQIPRHEPQFFQDESNPHRAQRSRPRFDFGAKADSPEDLGPREDQVGSRKSRIDKIPRRGQITEPTMQKFDYEMTDNEKKSISLESQLLEMQFKRDQVKSLINPLSYKIAFKNSKEKNLKLSKSSEKKERLNPSLRILIKAYQKLKER